MQECRQRSGCSGCAINKNPISAGIIVEDKEQEHKLFKRVTADDIAMSDSGEEGSEGASGVGVLDIALLVLFLAVVVLIVMRFRRKRAERNKLRDLKINTT